MKKILLILSLLICSVAEARPVRFVQKVVPSNYQLYQNNTIGAGQVVWKPDSLIPPNIVTRYDDWLVWEDYRRKQFEKRHLLDRSTKYYFSSSTGDDGNDCTIDEPCATRTKADTFDTANTELLFKRGDTWEECVAITLTADKMTVDAYGSGAKPYHSCFTGKINSGAGWSVFSGNTYSISNTQDSIGWVRNVADRLGDTASSAWYLASSNAFSDSGITFPAWFKDDATDTLYVNLGSATSPATINIEYSVNNRVSGVSTGATGIRVDNQRFDGFSLDRTSANHNAGYAIYFTGTGSESLLATNNEGYYTSAHVFGTYNAASSGSRAMWIGNKAGYPMFNGASSETIYNSYAASGLHESWFIENEANYGAVPMSTWGVSTDKVQSQAFYGHTSGSISGTHVAYDNDLPDTHHPVAELSGFSNCATAASESALPDVRCFVVKNTQVHATITGGALYSVAFAGYNITMNNRFAIAPRNTGGLALTLTRPVSAFFIQNHLKVDYSQWGTGARGLYNTTSADNIVYFWHNFIDLIDTTGTGASQFGIDYDTRGGAGDSSPNSTAYNNILSNDANSTYAGWYFGLNNEPTKMAGNAVFKITDTVAGNPSGYGDTDYVTLTTLPVIDQINEEVKYLGSTQIPFRLSHDIDGRKRNIYCGGEWPPYIGVQDFQSNACD